jgi:hypothetical protein
LVRSGTVDLAVRVQAGAGRSEIVGERDGRLVVRVAAKPIDGKANAALCALIAERAGVAKVAVSVVRGVAARDKVVRVEGVTGPALRAMLGLDG